MKSFLFLQNDLCPAMKLKEKDIVFVRKGYTLEKIINLGHTKSNIPVKILAKIIYFDKADTIKNNMVF